MISMPCNVVIIPTQQNNWAISTRLALYDAKSVQIV